MGRVKRRKHKARGRSASRPSGTPTLHTKTTTPRQAALLILFGLAVVTAGLVFLEVGLRISGYGGGTPLSSASRSGRLFHLTGGSSGRPVYATRPEKLTFFNYQEFAADKAPGTCRVFCFGGSSTYGRPYRWETAFPRWMELILNSSGSLSRFEVINVGGISYASYRVAHLVKEVLESDYEPDLLIVYTGHNEFLEEWAPEVVNARTRVLAYLNQLRLTMLFRALLNTGRTPSPVSGTQSAIDAEVDAILDRAAGLDYYVRDDARHRKVLIRYEETLERIVRTARSHDVPLVLVNMVSNLKDFSPFKSCHMDGLTRADIARWDSLYGLGSARMKDAEFGEAISVLAEAAEIGRRHADLQYSIACCFDSGGETARAESCYILARDEDICPLRAPSRVNETIRNVCVKNGVPLVDLLSHLRSLAHQRTGSPILGNEFFLDHIHLTIEGNQIMALAIVEKLAGEGLVDIRQIPDSTSLQLAFREAVASLDPDYMARMHLNLGKVLSWAGKGEEAAHHLALAEQMGSRTAETYYRVGKTHREAGRVDLALEEFKKALGVKPDYAAAHNDMGLCYLTMGNIDQAERCFRTAIELRPDQPMPHIGLGRCRARRGLIDEAIAQYEEAVALQPDYADGLNNLGAAYQEAGRLDEAEAAFQRALEIYPDFAEARNNLGLLYLSTGRTDLAEAAFRAAARSKPHLHQTYGNLGLVLLLKGDRRGAAAMFNKVLELNPGDPDATRFLADLE